MELRNCLLIVILNLRSIFVTEINAAGDGSISDPVQQFDKQGQEAVLQCRFERMNLKWYKNDTIIIANKGSVIDSSKYNVTTTGNGLYNRLHILNAQPVDEGLYVCRAGLNETYYIELNLYGSVSDPLQQYVQRGQEAVLQCKYKRESLKWYKNITIIANTGSVIEHLKYNVSKTSTGLYYRLHILNTLPDDEGMYICRGGIDESYYIQLNFYVPMKRLYFLGSSNITLEGTEGTDLLIRCIAEGGKPPPDVSILNGSRPNSTQEVSYTIPTISRDYHQKSIVCQATSDALDNPISTTVQIYLNLKPFTPIFNVSKVSTEETVPLTVSCTSYGSRPAATFTWSIGGNDVTSSSTTSTVTELNVTYTVTSQLTSGVNKTHNKQNIKCEASNSVGSVSAGKTLDVRYAPDITVTSPTYTQNDADRTVTCYPSGNPDSYTYHKWQHRSKYGELIREFVGDKTLKLPDVPVLMIYQDSGEYVCTASNGIKGKDNKFEQTGYGYVTINAQPVLTSDTNERVKLFGEINKDVDIYINVYSFPQFTSFEWIRNGKPITTQNSTKYESSIASTIVQDKIHGKEVQLDGYNVTLTIHDLTTEDLKIYTVTIQSGFGTIVYPVLLESSNAPETPSNFSSIKSAPQSVTVQWDPNLGWGQKQTFYMQYRVQGLGLLEWTTVLVGEEYMNEPKRRRTYQLSNLQKGKAFEIRMYAENTAGKRSNFTVLLNVFTESSEFTMSTAIIGGIIGAAVTLVIVCASVIILKLLKWRKGRNKTKNKDKCYENTGLKEIQKGNEYDEVGNTSDVEHAQSCKTYESLGNKMTKEVRNVYDDLENPQGVTSLESSFGHYDALGVQDQPNIYDEMKKSERTKTT